MADAGIAVAASVAVAAIAATKAVKTLSESLHTNQNTGVKTKRPTNK